MLTAVLRELRTQFGSGAVERVFDGLSRRAVERARLEITATEPEAKVAQLTEMLRKSGVVAEYSLIDGGFVLHEHNCPYSSAAKENPEVCQVIHHVIDETIGGEHAQTESLAHGGTECRFELHPVLRASRNEIAEYGFSEISASSRRTKRFPHDGKPHRER